MNDWLEMDFTKAIQQLNDAERELRAQISKSDGDDYDSMFDCLKLAKQVGELANKLSNFGSDVTPLSEMKACENIDAASPSLESIDDFPLYFLHEEKLWKVAERSGDSGELYKKSLPLSDVKIICSKIHELLNVGDTFTMANVEKALDGMPAYKAQITVMALVKTCLFQTAGRGKYTLAPGVSRSERKWLEALKGMDPHPEHL